MTAIALLLGECPVTISGTITINSTTSFPRIDFNTDGTITYRSNGISGLYYTRGWYQAANFGSEIPDIGAKYEIRLTPISGSFALELTDTWVALGTSWSRTAGNGSSTGTIEIRDKTTQVVVASCTIVLNDN